MTIGNRIKMLRTQKGITMEDLGAKVGVHKTAIYKYEKGVVVNLKRSVIAKLATALEVSPTYLMGLDDEIEKPAPNMSGLDKEIINMFSQLSDSQKVKVLSDLVKTLDAKGN